MLDFIKYSLSSIGGLVLLFVLGFYGIGIYHMAINENDTGLIAIVSATIVLFVFMIGNYISYKRIKK